MVPPSGISCLPTPPGLRTVVSRAGGSYLPPQNYGTWCRESAKLQRESGGMREFAQHDRARGGTYPYRITEHGAAGGTYPLPTPSESRSGGTLTYHPWQRNATQHVLECTIIVHGTKFSLFF
jgi:hypothetical protein